MEGGQGSVTLEQSGDFLADSTVRLRVASLGTGDVCAPPAHPRMGQCSENILLINNHPATIAAQKGLYQR